MNSKFQNWIKRNIVDDDPRPVEEQMEEDQNKSGLFFPLILITSILFYGLIFVLIFFT